MYKYMYRQANFLKRHFFLVVPKNKPWLCSKNLLGADPRFKNLNRGQTKPQNLYLSNFSCKLYIRLEPEHDLSTISPFAGIHPLKLASHCPEIDIRWPYECGILNFVRRWSLSQTRRCSKYDAYRRSQNGARTIHVATRRCEILFSSLPAGHTKVT